MNSKDSRGRCPHRPVTRIVSIILSFVMLFSITAGIDLSAYATSKTQSEAVNWANAQIGKSLDQDGVYGAQCVDLIRYYYQFLGVSPVSGNGCDYAKNSLPSGWQRIKIYNGFIPQPGDIAVWTYASSAYGHVAIITSADSSRMNVVEQNGSTHITRSHSYSYSYGTFYGVIRPNFASGSGDGSLDDKNLPGKPSIPMITILSNSQRQIKFEWNSSANTTCYNLFIFSENNTNNPIQSHWAIRKNELITTLPNGKYLVKLCSENETPSQNYYTDGDFSSVFEINDLIPDKPYLSIINITNSSRQVVFKWNSICNATCYNLFIYSVNNTDTPIQSHWAIRKNELITTLPNGKYVARLCSENETSNRNYYTDGDLSNAFEVNSLIPDKPNDPVINVDNNDGKVTFRWDKVDNASCYNLFIYSANDTTTT